MTKELNNGAKDLNNSAKGINGEYIIKSLEGDGAKVFCYDSVSSTNIVAKQLATAEGHGTLVVSDCQSAGRGRQGKNFYCESGCGVYMSVILKKIDDFMLITSAAAAAVRRAIFTVCGKETGIKWVNDIYYNGKKICGILSEGLSSHGIMYGAVVGIGINVFKCDFPNDVKNVATCLYDDVCSGEGNNIECGGLGIATKLMRERLIIEVYRELMRFCGGLAGREFLNDCRKFSIVLNKKIKVLGIETFEGLAVEIDGDGALIVQKEDGKRVKLVGGEISIRI